MLERPGPKGEVLFPEGDLARNVFYSCSDSMHLTKIEKTLGPGALFDQMGPFTPDRDRTAAAVCAEDCNPLGITNEDIIRHCLAEPSFGLFPTKLIATHMVENQSLGPLSPASSAEREEYAPRPRGMHPTSSERRI